MNRKFTLAIERDEVVDGNDDVIDDMTMMKAMTTMKATMRMKMTII